MNIGFTGTRRGMTGDQYVTVARLVGEWPEVREAHHGMAEGADSQFHLIAVSRGILTHGHPGVLPGGHPLGRGDMECTVTEDENLMLVRNRKIVRAVDVMIATPGEYANVPRGSGTWMTIRYAKSMRRWLIVVWPDGSVSEYKP